MSDAEAESISLFSTGKGVMLPESIPLISCSIKPHKDLEVGLNSGRAGWKISPIPTTNLTWSP